MTPIQKQLLDYLRSWKRDDVQPSLAEMGAYLGGIGRSSIHRMLQSLQEEGLVEKFRDGERCWRAVKIDPFDGVEDRELVRELAVRGYTGIIERVVAGRIEQFRVRTDLQ